MFRYFNNILLQCDTASNKTIHNDKPTKGAWTADATRHGTSKQDSFGSIFDEKANVTCLTDGNGKSPLADTLGPSDTQEKRFSEVGSVDGPSLDVPIGAFEDQIDDVQINLIVKLIEENKNEMKCMMEENSKKLKIMIENNRKEMQHIIEERVEEMRSMIEDTRKETQIMVEESGKEIRSITEDNRQEIVRLAENKKDLYKKMREQKHMKTSKYK